MANSDIDKTIQIIFTGTDDNLSKTLRGVNDKVGNFASSVRDATQPVADFTKGVLKAEAGLLAVGAAFGGAAIKSAGEFRQSIAEIGTLFNGTSDEVQKLEGDILNYSKSSTSSIEDINAATYTAISTGTKWGEVTETLAASETLATASKTSLSDATQLLSRSLNSYGEGADSAARFSDALFAAVQNGDTTMTALSQNLGKVAKTADGAGVEFGELTSATAAMTIAGVSTAESITKLKRLFVALAAPSEKLREAMNGTSLESHTLKEVMEELQKSTGGSLVEMNKLFPSVEAADAAMILANDSTGAFASTLEATANSAGITKKANDALAKSFENVNQNLANNVKASFITAGIQLLDGYTESVEGLAASFNGITEGLQKPNFKVIFDALNELLKDFGAKADAIAKVLPEAMENLDFSGLIDAFRGVSETAGGILDDIFGDIDLTKAEDLEKVLQGIVDIFENMVHWTDGAIKGLEPVIEGFAFLAEEAAGADGELVEFVGNVQGTITSINTFAGLLVNLTSALGTLGGAVLLFAGAKQLGLVAPAMASITGAATVLLGKLALLSTAFGAGYLTGTIINDLTGASDGVVNLTDALRGFFGGKTFEDMANDVQRLAEEQGAAERASNGYNEKLKEGSEVTKEVVKDLEYFDDIVNKASSSQNDMADGQERFNKQMQELGLASDGATKTLSELTGEAALMNSAFSDGKEVATQYWVEIANGIGYFTDLTGKVLDEKEALEALQKAKESTKLTTEEFNRYIERQGIALDGTVKNIVEYDKTLKEVDKKQKKVADASKELEKKLDREAKAFNAAADRANKLRVELEKIASDERIANMQLKIDFDIAQIEADTEKTVAAMETVAAVYAETEKTIASLWETMVGGGSDMGFHDKWALEDSIKFQEELARDQWETEKKLVEAQIENMKKATERMARGDALIQVDGGQLQPELESLMMSLFDLIRIKMSASYQDYLINAGAT